MTYISLPSHCWRFDAGGAVEHPSADEAVQPGDTKAPVGHTVAMITPERRPRFRRPA
jgi:hypothetical protein